MKVGADTDVRELIDEAYDELECVGDGRIPHGGEVAAYNYGHGCVDGYLCESHLQYYLDFSHPYNLDIITRYGVISCRHCQRIFTVLDSFRKVHVL